MVEALHSFMPPAEGSAAAQRAAQQQRVSASAAEVAMLFQVHPLAIQHMIPR